MWLYVGVLLLSLASDVLVTAWALSVSQRRAVEASVYSGLVTLFFYGTMMVCCSDPYLLVPAIFGHSAGTYLAVRYKK